MPHRLRLQNREPGLNRAVWTVDGMTGRRNQQFAQRIHKIVPLSKKTRTVTGFLGKGGVFEAE